MIWEDKVKMIQLGNMMGESRHHREQFHQHVLEKVGEFDMQSWDMFITIVDLIPSELKEDSEFWKKMYPILKEVDTDNPQFNFRSALRWEMLLELCEQDIIEPCQS